MTGPEIDASHPWWSIIRLAQSMGTKISVRLNIDGQEYVYAQGGMGELDLGIDPPSGHCMPVVPVYDFLLGEPVEGELP